MYYALTNLQGDVLGLYDAWGKKVAAYDYDAWGNATVYEVTQDENGNNVHTVVTEETDHISYVNPIRYRGYYYDSDLGLYYLQSRYYDSTVGRFINADGYITTGQGVLSYNMFAYCMSNPVNYIDSDGAWTISVMVTGNATAGIGVGGASGVAFDAQGNFDRQYSYAIPGVNQSLSAGGIDAGIGISILITRADSVYDLYGLGSSVGFSVGKGGYFGIDGVALEPINYAMNNEDQSFDGVQFTVGYGVGVDVHVNQNYTSSWGNFSDIKTVSDAVDCFCETMKYFQDTFVKFF